MFRRSVDGAEKCALRDLRLDEAMPGNTSDANARDHVCICLPVAVFMAAVVAGAMREVLSCDLSLD